MRQLSPTLPGAAQLLLLIPPKLSISESTKGVELEANIWKQMLRMFALMGRKGLPVVIKNGFEGTNFDATALRQFIDSHEFEHLSTSVPLIFLFLFWNSTSSGLFGSDSFVAKVIEEPAKWSCEKLTNFNDAVTKIVMASPCCAPSHIRRCHCEEISQWQNEDGVYRH